MKATLVICFLLLSLSCAETAKANYQDCGHLLTSDLSLSKNNGFFARLRRVYFDSKFELGLLPNQARNFIEQAYTSDKALYHYSSYELGGREAMKLTLYPPFGKEMSITVSGDYCRIPQKKWLPVLIEFISFLQKLKVESPSKFGEFTYATTHTHPEPPPGSGMVGLGLHKFSRADARMLMFEKAAFEYFGLPEASVSSTIVYRDHLGVLMRKTYVLNSDVRVNKHFTISTHRRKFRRR